MKFSLKSDSEFTIQYELSLYKLIREIEKYNKKKYNPEHNTITFPFQFQMKLNEIKISSTRIKNFKTTKSKMKLLCRYCEFDQVFVAPE